MDISNFVSGVTRNITNQTAPKSISGVTVGNAISDLAGLTKTSIELLASQFIANTASFKGIAQASTNPGTPVADWYFGIPGTTYPNFKNSSNSAITINSTLSGSPVLVSYLSVQGSATTKFEVTADIASALTNKADASTVNSLQSLVNQMAGTAGSAITVNLTIAGVGITKSGNTYSGTGAGFANIGVGDSFLKSGGVYSFTMQYTSNTTSPVCIFGLKKTNVVEAYTSNNYNAAFYVYSGSLWVIDNGGTPTSLGVAPIINNYYQIYCEGAGSTRKYTLKTSSDNVIYTNVYVYSFNQDVILYPVINISGTNIINNVALTYFSSALKANQSDLNDVITDVSNKVNQTNFTALSTTVAGHQTRLTLGQPLTILLDGDPFGLNGTVYAGTEYWDDTLRDIFKPATMTSTVAGNLLYNNRDFTPAGLYTYHNALASTIDKTKATSVVVNYYSNVYPDQSGQISVLVNGTVVDTIVPTASGAGSKTITLPTGGVKCLVEFREGGQQRSGDGGTIAGIFVVSKTYNDFAVAQRIVNKTNCAIVRGDSISVGIGTTHSPIDSMVSVLRARSEFTDWTLIATGYGFKGIYPTLSTQALVDAEAIQDVNRLASITGIREIWVPLGTNDWGFSYASPLDCATVLGAYIDKIHSLDGSIKIRLITPYKRVNETTANSFGATLQDYRNAIAAVKTPARADFMKVIDGNAINFLANSGDGTHPNTSGVTVNLVPNLISGGLTDPIISVAPILQTIIVYPDKTNTVIVSYDKPLNTTTGFAPSDFTISGHTVSGVTVSGNAILLTASDNFATGESITISGGNNKIQSSTSVVAANISNRAATNYVGVPNILKLTDITGSSITVTSNDVVGTAGGGAGVSPGFRIPANGVGYVQCVVQEVSSATGVLGLGAGSGIESFGTFKHGLYSEGSVYKYILNGVITASSAHSTAGDIMRLAAIKDPSTGVIALAYQYSSNSGTSWNTIYSVNKYVGDLWCKVSFYVAGRQLLDIRGIGY